MKRNLHAMADEQYDVLVIGGGIYGAALTWEATLRGLQVALVEKEDFGAATSANSLKIIHGGLRYLQHLDVARVRESVRERRALMRIAPHLVQPMPTLVPTYGHGIKGREAMALALLVYDVLSADRNHGLDDPAKHIPNGRTVSRRECLALAPGIPEKGLTGGAIYYDAQVLNSERLPLAFVKSAAQYGARMANYAEATGLLREGNRITGAVITDRLTGDTFEVRARTVANTAGPWVNRLLGYAAADEASRRVKLATALNVVTRQLFADYAVGLYGPDTFEDADAVLNRGSRLFFVAPWRGTSLIGTDYAPYEGDPDEFRITAADVEPFLADFNEAYPAGHLKLEDVTFVHGGLLPMKEASAQTGSVRLTKHFDIRDHRQDGLEGLLTVIGVKYTTARDVAERAVDRIFESWDKIPPTSTSATTRLTGGEIVRFDDFVQKKVQADPLGIGEAAMRRLATNYGVACEDVLAPAVEGRGGARAALRAEVIYVVRNEMALKLADVILRRTGLGSAGHPGAETLHFAAQVMARELDWTEARILQEIAEVEAAYPEWIGRPEVVNGTELADPTV